MRFDDCADAFETFLKANRGLSENTRKAYRCDLAECMDSLERLGCGSLDDVHTDDLRIWMSESSKRHARSSMARKTVAVRVFFSWAYEHGIIDSDPAAMLITPKIPDTLPAVLNESQAEQLMDHECEEGVDSQSREESPKQQAARIRDKAMLELLYATGMRVAELVGLDADDLVFSNRTVKVTGKGNKQRVIPFGAPAENALRRWLEQGRPLLCDSKSSDALFLGVRGGRIDQRMVRRIVHEHARNAGVPDISPHALRHSAATHMLDGERTCVRSRNFLGTVR